MGGPRSEGRKDFRSEIFDPERIQKPGDGQNMDAVFQNGGAAARSRRRLASADEAQIPDLRIPRRPPSSGLPEGRRTFPVAPGGAPAQTKFRLAARLSPEPNKSAGGLSARPPFPGMNLGKDLLPPLVAVPQRIVIYFTPKGETHDGLLPASSTHGS
jgi:hypothetical protein